MRDSMSAGEKALSMALRIIAGRQPSAPLGTLKPCSIARFWGFLGDRGVLAQDAIDQFRKLGTQTVQYPLEQGRLDVARRLAQERIGQSQCLRQDGRMQGVVVEW